MAFVMSHTLNLQHSESDGQTNDEQRKKKAGGFYFRIRVHIRNTYFDNILKKSIMFKFSNMNLSYLHHQCMFQVLGNKCFYDKIVMTHDLKHLLIDEIILNHCIYVEYFALFNYFGS